MTNYISSKRGYSNYKNITNVNVESQKRRPTPKAPPGKLPQAPVNPTPRLSDSIPGEKLTPESSFAERLFNQ